MLPIDELAHPAGMEAGSMMSAALYQLQGGAEGHGLRVKTLPESGDSNWVINCQASLLQRRRQSYRLSAGSNWRPLCRAVAARPDGVQNPLR